MLAPSAADLLVRQLKYIMHFSNPTVQCGLLCRQKRQNGEPSPRHQSYRVPITKVSKNTAKVPYLDADVRVGSQFGLGKLGQNQKKSLSIILVGLIVGTKFLAILTKVVPKFTTRGLFWSSVLTFTFDILVCYGTPAI